MSSDFSSMVDDIGLNMHFILPIEKNKIIVATSF